MSIAWELNEDLSRTYMDTMDIDDWVNICIHDYKLKTIMRPFTMITHSDELGNLWMIIIGYITGVV